MTEFLDGAAFAGLLGVAVWFLRSWSDTRDRLLLAFAVAFGILAVNRILIAALDRPEQTATELYAIRAAAFILIIAAIVGHNRRTS